MIRKSFLYFFFVAVIVFSSRLCAQNGLSISATAELFTVASDLGAGGDIEFQNTKFVYGGALSFSRDHGREVYYPLRIVEYQFNNYQLSGQFLYRFTQREKHGGELGLCYTFFRSHADYLDWFPSFYKFQFNGNYDMHFAGIMMGGRQNISDRFFIRMHWRYLLQIASFEYPDYKLVAIYDPNWTPDENMKKGRSYFSIKLGFGMMIRKKNKQLNPSDD
ncbi:MAG TPA: hypothetical protein PK798_11895 [Flavobacteriales bacterium]|nr:hypothetical protein [Flavobacteriales bacterium]